MQTEKNKEKPSDSYISRDEIISYIRYFNYDKLFKLLKEKKKYIYLDRFEFTVYRLLEMYKGIKSKTFEPTRKYSYESPSWDHLKMMFEAIKSNDLDTAFQHAKESLKFINDTTEVELYVDIMQNTIDLIHNDGKTDKLNDYVNTLDKNIIDTIKDKNSLSDDEMDYLYSLLEERKGSKSSSLNGIFYNILYTIEVANYYPIDETYFASAAELGLEPNKYACKDKLFVYLNSGDFVSAHKYIDTLGDKFNMFSKNERLILKYLLNILYNSISKKYVDDKDYEKLERMEEEYRVLRSYVKKYQFRKALEYALSIKGNKYIDEAIPHVLVGVIGNNMREDAISKEFYSTEDKNKRRIAIIDYEDLLNRTDLINDQECVNKLNEMKLLQKAK